MSGHQRIRDDARATVSEDIIVSRDLVIFIMLFFVVFGSCSQSCGGDLDKNSIDDLRNSCKILSIEEVDCQCIVNVSDSINDNNIAGRFVLGIQINNNDYTRNLASTVENSEFYEGLHPFSRKDKLVLFIGRISRFKVDLKNTCNIDVDK